MADCTAPVRGHTSSKAIARCPVHRGWSTAALWTIPAGTTPAPVDVAAATIDAVCDEAIAQISEQPDPIQLERALFDLLDAMTASGVLVKRGQTSHLLCTMFEELALALAGVLAVPADLARLAVGDEVNGSKLLATVLQALVTRMAATVIAPALAPIAVLHFKVCVCAEALCPNEDEHPSLVKNCTPTVLGGMPDSDTDHAPAATSGPAAGSTV